MNYPNLNEDIFKKAANTYFINSGETLIKDNIIYEVIADKTTQRYPVKNKPKIINGVYVKSNHFRFWNILYKYVPQGSFISHAYVSPENQARIGIQLLETNYPTIDLNEFIGNETNPELIGKYKDLFLFQLDYDKVKHYLSDASITWAKPNTSIHQRGLALDITINEKYYDIFVEILKWFYLNNNDILNLSGIFIKQSNNEIHIEFNEDISNIINPIGNTFLVTNGINSPVSNFLKDKDSRFYEILKNNGHLDLVDTKLNKQTLSKLPLHAKKSNSALAKAIREILDDSLGGPGGIISSLVQSQLDYSLSLINGLLGVVSVLADELDPLTDGRASILFKEAMESEIEKTSDNKFIKNKALEFSPILPEDSDMLKIKENTVINTNNTKLRKDRINKSITNKEISKKDTKSTPDQTEPYYDSMRSNLSQIETHELSYDHFGDMTTEFVINLETNIGRYRTNVNKIISKLITHNLHSSVVKAYAKDLKGSDVIFSQTTVNNNQILVEFKPEFSGSIEIH